MPRQMINLVGLVVVVALLVAGVTLIALPMYGSARAIDSDTAAVAQANDLYDVRVATLSGAKERIDEIDADVSGLRGQIAGSSQLDDVMLIVVDAAESAGATIEGVSAADPEPFAPRTGLTSDDGSGTAPVDDPAAPAPEPTPTEGDASESTERADAADAADAAPAEGATVDEGAAASPQLQIPITISVTVPDSDAAAAFMDALGRGPRLLSLIDGSFEGETLTVTALALVRTED
jgi:hypothetical protein